MSEPMQPLGDDDANGNGRVETDDNLSSATPPPAEGGETPPTNPLMSYFDDDESDEGESSDVVTPAAEAEEESAPSNDVIAAAPQTEAAQEDSTVAMDNPSPPTTEEIKIQIVSENKADGEEGEKINGEASATAGEDQTAAAEATSQQQQQHQQSDSTPDKPNEEAVQGNSSNSNEIDAPNSEDKEAENDDNSTDTQQKEQQPTNQSTENDTQNDAIIEAERQAAIAAAISANSPSSMSPSVAAGIAKKMMALPGLMSDKVSEMSDKVSDAANQAASVAMGGGVGGAGGGGGSGRQYPPPPPRSNNNGGSGQYQSGPTMVAMPPIPPPHALPPRGGGGGAKIKMPMRPVRFEDVRGAFDELLAKEMAKEREKKKGKTAKVDDDKETKVTDKSEISEKLVDDEKAEGESSETTGLVEKGDIEVDKEKSGEDGSDGGEASSTDESNEENGNEEQAPGADEEVKGSDESTNDATDVGSKKNDTKESGTSKAQTPEPGDETKQLAPTIPDSFLRFLLLVARVPIIVEEHKKPTPPTSPIPKGKGQKSDKVVSDEGPKMKTPQAATAAAKRAYGIFTMARRSYEQISDRQHKSSLLDSSGKKVDATASFFAACSGEKIANEESSDETMENNLDKSMPSTGMNGQGGGGGKDPKNLPPLAPPPLISSPSANTVSTASSSTTASSSATLTAASSMASSVFSNVMSKMTIPKRQASFTDIGKKIMSAGSSHGQQSSGGEAEQRKGVSPDVPTSPMQQQMHDYEILINNEMLGLTVENVLERTIIRTLLPDGAAKHAGAQVGSLIAKVGNVDTSNLTHFETIDELRRSQRPLKLTLRHVGGDVLRRAREEMGRLIRGHGITAATSGGDETTGGNGNGSKPWRDSANNSSSRKRPGETFDSVLSSRWPSRSSKSSLAGNSSAPLALTRAEMMHRAGKNLIRILALLVVGLEKELASLNDVGSADSTEPRSHQSEKELIEAIEISSKILFDFARGLPDVDDKQARSGSGGGSTQQQKFQQGSSFYPVPPGRVQGKKHGTPPSAGRGSKGQKQKKSPANSPLLRIGDALQRTRSFLVEISSTTATVLRWEIIDYLCVVLDLDTEQELSENESASSSAPSGNGGDQASGSPMNDLGAAGSILKLIVLNCSTNSADDSSDDDNAISTQQQHASSDAESQSSLDQSTRSKDTSTAGNPFLSVVHRLAASKSTSARVSACSLGPVLWSHLDFPRQLQLRGVITRALHDVEVIVRKSTAGVLHEIAELVFDRRAVPWLVLMCERSMTDPEPQLRAAAMTLTWHLAEHLPNAFLGDASEGSRSLRRLPPRDSATFMDVYLLQCKLLPVANNLAEDRIASVRLSVAAQCDRLCNALGEHWFSVIIDLLQALLSDGDENVRSEAILCMPRLVESVFEGTSSGESNITVLESLLPLALKIQKDTSPVVRSSLAVATGELLIFLVGLGGGGHGSSVEPPPSPEQPPLSPGRGSIGTKYADHKKHVDDTLIPILQKLLQDSNPEVTTASLRAVTNASRSTTARRDSSTQIPHTSKDIASSGMSDHNIDDDLVSLSSHQSHTSYERKPVFIPVLSEKQVLRLLPTLSNLATSTQWRVRQSAVEIVPALMGCTHRHETRHEISKLCLRLMEDKVDAVRKTAAECLCLGGSSLARHGEEDGGEWIRSIVIPHLRTCGSSVDSKQRLLSLKMIEIIITNGLCPTPLKAERNASPSRPPSSPNDIDDESTASSITEAANERPMRMILNIAASHISDNVANVRLNVGRTFCAVMPLLVDGSDVDFAVETLEKQLEEETSRPGGGDRDVIWFANQAITLSQPLRRTSSITSNN